jgi:hypothetical protein
MVETTEILNKILERLESFGATMLWQADWLDADKMAAMIGMEAGTLRKAAAQGDIPGHKLPGRGKGGHWVFSPQEVSKAIWNQGEENSAVQNGRVNRKAADIIASFRQRR